MSMIPCLHPQHCGVETHRAGSAAAQACNSIGRTNSTTIAPPTITTSTVAQTDTSDFGASVWAGGSELLDYRTALGISGVGHYDNPDEDMFLEGLHDAYHDDVLITFGSGNTAQYLALRGDLPYGSINPRQLAKQFGEHYQLEPAAVARLERELEYKHRETRPPLRRYRY